MKCKCFVDRFVSTNSSMKRLALSGIVIVKLIISGKQFNYWHRNQIFGIFNPIRSGMFQTANDSGRGGGALKNSPPPLQSRNLLYQSSPCHTCAFY